MFAFDSPPLETPMIDPDDSADEARQASGLPSARASQGACALGEMTLGLAHDLRNILTVIASAISLAERNAEDRVKRGAALSAACEGIQRGLTLTGKLFAFAKPQPTDVHVEDVNGLLEKLRRFLKYAAGTDIGMRLDLSAGILKCELDPAEFCAAILNLVVNARDAMPGGGEIRITTSLTRLLESANPDADTECVLVRVIDQGLGMTREVRERIFDPYFTTKKETGTGLGVPQVAAFMRSAGGCLNVSSEPGAGTSFDLFFPVPGSAGLIGTSLWRQLDRWANEGGRNWSVALAGGH